MTRETAARQGNGAAGKAVKQADGTAGPRPRVAVPKMRVVYKGLWRDREELRTPEEVRNIARDR